MNRNKLLRIKDFITPVTQHVSETRCNKRRKTQIRKNWPNHIKNCSKNSSIYTSIVPNVFWSSTSKTNYTIVRPLIRFSRRTVTLNCFLRGLPVYPDLSNSKMRYSRNRIRKQIIPAMKFLLNPKLERALFQFSEFYNRDIALNRVNNL